MSLSEFGESLHKLVASAHIETLGDPDKVADIVERLTSTLGGAIAFSTDGDPLRAARTLAAVKVYLESEVARCIEITRAPSKTRRPVQ
jgi:hypothetical protein